MFYSCSLKPFTHPQGRFKGPSPGDAPERAIRCLNKLCFPPLCRHNCFLDIWSLIVAGKRGHCVGLLPPVQESLVQAMVEAAQPQDLRPLPGQFPFKLTELLQNFFSRGACKLLKSITWSSRQAGRLQVSLRTMVEDPEPTFHSCLRQQHFSIYSRVSSSRLSPVGLGGLMFIVPILVCSFLCVFVFGLILRQIELHYFHSFKSETRDVMLTCLEKTCGLHALTVAVLCI